MKSTAKIIGSKCPKVIWLLISESQIKTSFKSFPAWRDQPLKKYGGKVLARGPVADRLEGDVSGIVMMVEFESKEAANKFYYSEEYQAAKAVREECSDTDLMIAEGVSD